MAEIRVDAAWRLVHLHLGGGLRGILRLDQTESGLLIHFFEVLEEVLLSIDLKLHFQIASINDLVLRLLDTQVNFSI